MNTPNNTIKITDLTHLGFLITGILDEKPAIQLSFREIHDAATDRLLVALIMHRLGHLADFYFVRTSRNFDLLEAALSDAACALYGREPVTNDGLCLLLDIVLEAIQQQLHHQSQPQQVFTRSHLPELAQN